MSSTPTPWLIESDDSLRGVAFIPIVHYGSAEDETVIAEVVSNGADEFRVRGITAKDRANAELIVRAVNCHHELVTALSEFLLIKAVVPTALQSAHLSYLINERSLKDLLARAKGNL